MIIISPLYRMGEEHAVLQASHYNIPFTAAGTESIALHVVSVCQYYVYSAYILSVTSVSFYTVGDLRYQQPECPNCVLPVC